MAVHNEQADVATVELTGSGIDIILPPPTAPTRRVGPVRLIVALGLAVGVLAVAGTQLISFDGGGLLPSLAPATRILPAGAPRPQTLARQDQLVLLVPVQQSRITAILFHPVMGADALPLDPVGQPVDQGIVSRLIASFQGENAGGPRGKTAIPPQFAENNGAQPEERTHRKVDPTGGDHQRHSSGDKGNKDHLDQRDLDIAPSREVGREDRIE